MKSRIVVSTVGPLKLVVLIVTTIIMFYPAADQGVSYFGYSNLESRSMYVRSLGLSAYLGILFGYLLIVYLSVVNITFYKNLIYIDDGYLYHYWKRVCKLCEIDFNNVDFNYVPISIIINTKDGKIKKINTFFSRKSNREIVDLLKAIQSEKCKLE
jgi:hypothetical protein